MPNKHTQFNVTINGLKASNTIPSPMKARFITFFRMEKKLFEFKQIYYIEKQSLQNYSE